MTDIIGERGLGATSNFRIDYTVTGAGRVVPFATFIDDVTGDGVFQAAADPEATSEDLVVAQASHATGANGDFFRTDLHVTNLGSGAGPGDAVADSARPHRFPAEPARLPPRTRADPGSVRRARQRIRPRRTRRRPACGSTRAAPRAWPFSTRTAVEKFGGTFGFSIPGLRASEAIGAGDGKATVIQLDSSSSAQGFRSNFGFAEVAGAPAPSSR